VSLTRSVRYLTEVMSTRPHIFSLFSSRPQWAKPPCRVVSPSHTFEVRTDRLPVISPICYLGRTHLFAFDHPNMSPSP
jgi:hypothetical protein